MRNLLDTDAFVVGMLVMCLCVYQLATDHDARRGLIELGTGWRSASEHDEQQDHAQDGSDRNEQHVLATVPSGPTPVAQPEEPTTFTSLTTSTDSLGAFPRHEALRDVRSRPPVYPMAVATVESSGYSRPVDEWNAPYLSMPSDGHCQDPQCPCWRGGPFHPYHGFDD